MSIMGKPLLAYSIEHSLSSNLITRTIVSTDSTYYAEIAKSFGAETPFLRPVEIAQDLSTDFEVFFHALNHLQKSENYLPEIVVHLRPTHPVRNPEHIDKMIELLKANPHWDSIRSVAPAPETPYKMWFIENDVLKPVIGNTNINEPYNQPRQSLPPTFLQNASIDVMWSKTILNKHSMTGDIIGAFIMTDNYDIDTYSDLQKLNITNGENFSGKTFCFDIDGVVAQLSPGNDYNLSKPNKTVIEKVNSLYEKGNYIILFTARGSKTGIDWQEITKNQMQEWGVNYHELKFGKPAADFYIDDRLINIEQL